MNSLHPTFGAAFLPLLFGTALFGADPVIKPVTPNALPEAAALLATLQEISGRYTLTGQHNPPSGGDRNSILRPSTSANIRRSGPAILDSRRPVTRTPRWPVPPS